IFCTIHLDQLDVHQFRERLHQVSLSAASRADEQKYTKRAIRLLHSGQESFMDARELPNGAILAGDLSKKAFLEVLDLLRHYGFIHPYRRRWLLVIAPK